MKEPETGIGEDPAPELYRFARTALSKRLGKMLSEAEGAASAEKSEPVHQMRVWSRRSRAAYDLFHACFPTKEYRSLGRELKKLTGALGAARDLDVMIESLRHEAETLPENQRAGVDRFIAQLRSRRRSRQKAVSRAVKRLETSHLAERFAHLLDLPMASLGSHPVRPIRHPVGRKLAEKKAVEEKDEP